VGHHHDRLRIDPATRAYAQRRTTQGKTTKEIMRCLKRYLARELFLLLKAGACQPR
jgi:transposase